VRRIALLTTALLIPLIPAAPAFAAGHVICVGSPAGPCDQTVGSIPAAITIAAGNGQSNTILVGPGTYTDGPYDLDGSSSGLTLMGSGQDATFLTLPAGPSETYVMANKATVRDLTITMNQTTSSNDLGLSLSNADAKDVTVDGTGTTNSEGATLSGSSHVEDSTIALPLDTGGTGVYGDGGVVVQDTAITADYAYSHSGTGTPDTLSRLYITARSRGVVTDSGEVDVDDTVVDLGTEADSNGLVAANFNNSTATKTIHADHVTIVGGGTNSRGVWAYAQTLTAQQHSDITLTNSIIRGPETNILVGAANDGSQGGNSTASVTTSYTDWSRLSFTVYNGANGTAQLVDGATNLDVDPAFVAPTQGNYRLSAASPLIDQGDPATGGPDTDLSGGVRVFDGDGDLTARRDLGAYERSDLVAPNTTVTAGPSGATRDTTPTFSFGANEAGTSFECRVDAAAYGPCSSPYTAGALANGAHTFSVRATDLSGNTDASAAQRAFKVDTVAPDTRFSSKPAKHVTTRKVTFRFASTEAASTFQCKLDKKPWRACISPKKVRVKVGRHRFQVRSVDAAGNVDATPAAYRFKRIR